MKVALILCTLLCSIAAKANTPWLKKPALYFYQDNSILDQRIGTDTEINTKAQQVYDAFIKNTASVKKSKNEKPFYFIVVFNDKDSLKFWIKSENQKRQQFWEEISAKVLQEVQFKSLSGSTAIAFYFGIEGLEKPLEAKPPIVEEWYKTIEKTQKIGASELFDQLLTERN